MVGFCTVIFVRTFELLFSKSVFEGFPELMKQYLIFDNCLTHCLVHFHEQCSGEDEQFPVKQHQSLTALDKALKGSQKAGQAAFSRLSNEEDSL